VGQAVGINDLHTGRQLTTPTGRRQIQKKCG
jgi:hypothetical protein